MKKVFLSLLLQAIISNNLILAHCQIPCGIYDDALRIIILKENFQTIKKSMEQIVKLSNQSDALSKNQITRWITTKEYHSQNVQKIISEYFLTQRINESDESYIDKTTLLQKLLVISMKCKQTVDTKHIEEAIILIEKFSKLYFDKHDFNHLMELSD